MNPQILADRVVQLAEDKKAFDIVTLDIRSISTIADYFIICSGRSSIHVQSIAQGIMDTLAKNEGITPRKEGFKEGRWVLLDYGDVVVHVFQDEERHFYHLERLWGDALLVNKTIDNGGNNIDKAF